MNESITISDNFSPSVHLAAQHVCQDVHYVNVFWAQAHYTHTHTHTSFMKSTSWIFRKCEPDPYLNDVGHWAEWKNDSEWQKMRQWLSLTSLCRHTASPWKQKSL